MTNRMLSDIDNYEAYFDSILDSIFNETNYAKQPKYLIDLQTCNGSTLRYAYNHIKNATKRGMDILGNPLTVIAIVSQESLKEQVHHELLDIPHHVVVVPEKLDAERILKELVSLGIEDTKLCLYLDLFSDQPIPFSEYTGLDTQFGVISLRVYQNEDSQLSAETYYKEAANAGWFSKVIYRHPKKIPLTLATLSYFEKKDYRIRPGTVGDFAAIVSLEKNCKNELHRLPSHVIQHCLDHFPNDQFILETDKGFAGFLLSQRIKNLDVLTNVQEQAIDTLGDEKGSISLLIMLEVVPEKNELRDCLLKFFVQQALVTNDVTHAAAVLRCESFPGEDVLSMESYLEELIEEKGSPDRAIKIHLAQGAEIKGLIKKFRPEDKKNLGYGILVVYPRSSLLFAPQQVSEIEGYAEEITPELIEKRVDQMINVLLPKTGNIPYSRNTSFEDLGFDSNQLLQLRASVSTEFLIDLSRNFFTIHQTPLSVINFLIETKLKRYQQWLYEIKWQNTAIPDPNTHYPKNSLWILFEEPNDEVVLSLKKLFHEQEQSYITVSRGDQFRKENDTHYIINSSSLEDYTKLFNDIKDSSRLKGIIHLWNVSETISEKNEPAIEILESAHRSTLEGVLFLSKALATTRFVQTPSLWVVIKSLKEDGKVSSLIESPLNSLCKIAREEYNKFNCRVIVIDPRETPIDTAGRLFNELRSATNERQVAFRKGERLVPRLVRWEVDEVRMPKFSPHAFYLIAGCRPLGLLLARWYASHGAKYLILLDEIEMYPEMTAMIEELKNKGVETVYEKIKLDDEASIEQLFERINRDYKPLKGIVHTVGVVANELMMNMDWNQFLAVHRLKVTLSWHLHRYSQKFDLDHFILFSSCLAYIAPFGKANHITGNSFLDVLSHYRWKRALPSLTINWGPWELRHMHIRGAFETNTSDRLEMIEIRKGLQALDHLLYIRKPQVMAAIVNWPNVIRSVGETTPLFSEIAIEMGYKKAGVLNQYMHSTPENKKSLIHLYLNEIIRKILKLRATEALDCERSFKDIGMDSHKIAILQGHIQFDLQEAVIIPSNFVEKNNSLDKLAHALELALDKVLNSKSKPIDDEPLAVIGLKENSINQELLRKNGITIEIKALTDEVIQELKKKIEKPESNKVSTIIIMEKNE